MDGTEKVQTYLGDVIRLLVVGRQLLTPIGEIVHPQLTVEPEFITTVLPFHLTVVFGRRYADTVVQDVHVYQCLLEQGLMRCLFNEQGVRELCAVVGLYFTDGEGRGFKKLHKKIFCAVRAVFFVHLSECPTGAFVHRRELVILFAIRYTPARNILYINLNLLAGVVGSLIGFRFLCGFFLRFFADQSLDYSVHAVVMAGVSLLTYRVPEKNTVIFVPGVVPENQSFFFLCVLFRMAVGAMAALKKTFPMSIPLCPPFVDRLPAAAKPYPGLRYAVLVGITDCPLTIAGV